MYVYFYSVHVSGNYVPIIRRITCITALPVKCHSGRPSGMQVFIPACIPDGRPHRVTYTRYRIYTVNSPDDGHTVARNMYRIEINIHERFVRQFGLFTKVILGSTVNKP